MTWVDHVFAVTLLFALPAYGAWDAARFARRVAADPKHARIHEYLWTMGLEWGLSLTLLAWWRQAGRAAGDLGLTIPAGVGWWLTIVFVVAAAVFFASQLRTVAVSEDARASVRVQLEAQPAVRLIVPASRREAKVFSALALTAGACEELLYRGFLLHYLRFWLPGGIAVGAAIVAFAAAHAYQGLRGVVLTGVAGAAAMAVYLVTGSLLAPAILHAVLDLANGLTAYLVGPTASVLDAQISDSA